MIFYSFSAFCACCSFFLVGGGGFLTFSVLSVSHIADISSFCFCTIRVYVFVTYNSNDRLPIRAVSVYRQTNKTYVSRFLPSKNYCREYLIHVWDHIVSLPVSPSFSSFLHFSSHPTSSVMIWIRKCVFASGLTSLRSHLCLSFSFFFFICCWIFLWIFLSVRRIANN